MSKLDFAHFKKIHQDNNSATLKHPDGHEIKIAMSGLSSDMKKKLTKLPIHAAEGEVVQAGTSEPEVAPPPTIDAVPPPAEAPATASPPSEAPAAPEQAGPIQNVAYPPQSPAEAAAPAVLSPINAQELKDEHVKTGDDLAVGHIKPETYSDLFAKKDTLGKIGTIFGLMLSGAGSGLSGQPNALLAMMDKQISNDLEAQKSSASNSQNLYHLNQQNEYNKANIANLQKQGLLTESQAKLAETDAKNKAYALARMQANQMGLHKLVMEMNKLPVGSPDRQKAEQQLALLSNGVQAENFNIADRAAAASALAHTAFGADSSAPGDETAFQQQQGVLRMSGNEALANDRAARHMPGVPGFASIPLNGEDRAQIQGAQALTGSLQRLKDFAEKNPRPIKGSKADIEGKALAAQVQGDFRMATHGGVYKEGEQNFINQVVPGDPTTWNPFAHVTDKIDTVLNETKARNDQFLAAKGFQQSKGSSQNSVAKKSPSKASPQEGQTASNSKGEKVVFKNGSWTPVNSAVAKGK